MTGLTLASEGSGSLAKLQPLHKLLHLRYGCSRGYMYRILENKRWEVVEISILCKVYLVSVSHYWDTLSDTVCQFVSEVEDYSLCGYCHSLMKEGPQVCPGGSQARWGPISSIVPDMLRPSTLHSRTSPRFQLHEGSPVGWFPENARRWNEATPLCQIGCKETTSRTYSGLWTKCTMEKKDYLDAQHHRYLSTQWSSFVACTLPWGAARCIRAVWTWWRSSIPVAYWECFKNTLVAWLNTMFSQSKSYIIPMPPILKGVLYSYSKNTANIAHQSKKKKNSVFYLTSLKKPKGDIWFGTTPIGHSTLSKTMKCLCDAVGIGGF